MNLASWNITGCVILGEDLVCCSVRGGPLGVSSREGPVLSSLLTMNPEDARRATSVVSSQSKLVLVCPAEWCAIRAVSLPISKWDAAKDEMLRNVATLFPMASSDAMIGFFDRGDEAGGYLIAVDRSRLDPWRVAVERAFGRPVDAVLSPQMALVGLGYQDESETIVLERTASGAPLAHRLVHGVVRELGMSSWQDDSSTNTKRMMLPSAVAGAKAVEGSRAIRAGELALAAAMATRIGSATYRPLSGRSGRPVRRWIPAAAALAGAGLLLVTAGSVQEWRYQSAINSMDEEATDQAGALAQVLEARRETERLAQRLDAVATMLQADAWPAMKDLTVVQGVIPPDGFLYRVELDGRTVTIRGEAKRAGDVLRALEDTVQFRSARELDAPVTVEERGLEMFSIRAEREAGVGGAP